MYNRMNKLKALFKTLLNIVYILSITCLIYISFKTKDSAGLTIYNKNYMYLTILCVLSILTVSLLRFKPVSFITFYYILYKNIDEFNSILTKVKKMEVDGTYAVFSTSMQRSFFLKESMDFLISFINTILAATLMLGLLGITYKVIRNTFKTNRPIKRVPITYNHNNDKEYDIFGYDQYGYDREGYDAVGYDQYGYDRQGYDVNGRDIGGVDREGYNIFGYNIAGYDKEGYDRQGYDREGYDREGYNYRGEDRDGYNSAGYDAYGYDRSGYNPSEDYWRN